MSNQSPSEQTPDDSGYLQIDREGKFPPPYIMDLMMGINAQRRRAFLLQNQYLTPLTFEYAVFTFFVRFVMMCVVCAILSLLWIFLGKFNPIVYFCAVVSLISIYLGYQWAVSKNTKTVKEEVIFNTLVNTLALFFAVYTVFDLKSAFVSLYVWLMSSPF